MRAEDLDPDNEFERRIGFNIEAEKRERAVQWLHRYDRGLLTVEELGRKLQETSREVEESWSTIADG